LGVPWDTQNNRATRPNNDINGSKMKQDKQKCF